MDHQTQLDDTVMAGGYRECINQGLPLPEELVRWFNGVAERFALNDGTSVAEAKLNLVSNHQLGFTPQRWHEILESENA